LFGSDLRRGIVNGFPRFRCAGRNATLARPVSISAQNGDTAARRRRVVLTLVFDIGRLMESGFAVARRNYRTERGTSAAAFDSSMTSLTVDIVSLPLFVEHRHFFINRIAQYDGFALWLIFDGRK